MRRIDVVILSLLFPCMAEVMVCAAIYIAQTTAISEPAMYLLMGLMVVSVVAAVVGGALFLQSSKSLLLWGSLGVFVAAVLASGLEIMMLLQRIQNVFA